MTYEHFSHHPLERVAIDALLGAGYEVATATLGDLPLTVAEDPYSVIGVMGRDQWTDVAPYLEELPTTFANWASGRGAGGKQWDLYLLVLLQSQIEPEQLRGVELWVEDLSLVRRIVRAGVTPRAESIRTALAPFLPIDAPAETLALKPLEDLTDRIRLKGVDPEVATQAMASFRSKNEVSVG